MQRILWIRTDAVKRTIQIARYFALHRAIVHIGLEASRLE
jgi:hypothetical protein